MKVFIVLCIILYTSEALLTKTSVSEKWEDFKRGHGRRFRSTREEQFRKQVFHKNLEQIQEHNERYSKGLETYEMGVNQFTDFTEEELYPYTHGLQAPMEAASFTSNLTFDHSSLIRAAAALPSSFDWRSKGMVTPVKNQASCGSCWAFSTTGAIESHYKIRTGATVSLSEQQLVDCVTASFGCSGGWMPDAYVYIAQNGGINYDRDYPYEARDASCRYKSSKTHIAIRGYAYITGSSENALKDAVVTQGPISVAFDATGLSSYSGGVYYNPSCSTNKFTHAVVIVGYGNENGQDYWLVKNSWGSNWGQGGFFKIARNRGNHCGIATYPSYPVF